MALGLKATYAIIHVSEASEIACLITSCRSLICASFAMFLCFTFFSVWHLFRYAMNLEIVFRHSLMRLVIVTHACLVLEAFQPSTHSNLQATPTALL